MKRRTKNKVEAGLTTSGQCVYRRDKKAFKIVSKFQTEDHLLVTRPVRALLFPLSIEKIKFLLGLQSIPDFNSGVEMLLGQTIETQKFNQVFQSSNIFERAAKMDYEKATERVKNKRLKKSEKILKNAREKSRLGLPSLL